MSTPSAARRAAVRKHATPNGTILTLTLKVSSSLSTRYSPSSCRSAHAHVALQLQVDERRHGPEIDLDVGVDLLRIDFAANQSLAADADVDAGLLERVDQGDVGIVPVVPLRVGLVAHHDVDIGRSLVKHDDNVPMFRRHAVLS